MLPVCYDKKAATVYHGQAVVPDVDRPHVADDGRSLRANLFAFLRLPGDICAPVSHTLCARSLKKKERSERGAPFTEAAVSFIASKRYSIYKAERTVNDCECTEMGGYSRRLDLGAKWKSKAF